MLWIRSGLRWGCPQRTQLRKKQWDRITLTGEQAESLSGTKISTGEQRSLLGISKGHNYQLLRIFQQFSGTSRDVDKISHKITILGILLGGDVKLCGEQPPDRNASIRHSFLTTEETYLLREERTDCSAGEAIESPPGIRCWTDTRSDVEEILLGILTRIRPIVKETLLENLSGERMWNSMGNNHQTKVSTNKTLPYICRRDISAEEKEPMLRLGRKNHLQHQLC